MKRTLLLCMLASLTATAHATGLWDSLWHNADQQGERLLQQGKTDEAAQTYRDPRRRAYAELQAGHYSDAAKHYADFNDSESNYNRGNALAQAGQLQDAVKAYDAALTQDPNNRDARHNRDLVAQALQQQQQQQPAASGNNTQDGKNGDNQQNGQSGNTGNANQNAGKQGSTQDKSAQQNSSGQNNGGQDSAAQQQGNKAQNKNGSAQQNAQGQPAQQTEGEQSSSAERSGSSSRNGNAAQADDAGQARHDAEAALGNPSAGKPSTAIDLPASEQQLAQEQWLRRIPDDPGGLLRRKFMIEHMIRHQGRQP